MAMWKLLALLLCLSLALSCVRSDDEYGDDDDEKEETAKPTSDVVVITNDNFDTYVKKAKFALVEFYAPWCGHCQKLEPEYAKAATELKKIDPSIVIAKCDATENKDLASKFDVKGYPTIKWFVDGEVALDYNGGRDTEGIVKWVKKKTGPAATTVADKAALQALEDAEEAVVLGYFEALEGDAYSAFVKAAQAIEDVAFAQTTDAKAAAAAGLKKPGVVVVSNFRTAGEPRATAVLEGAITAEAVKEFVAREKLPPFLPFNEQNSQKIFGSGIEQQLLLLAKSEDLEPSSSLIKAYKAASKEHKGKLVFVTVDLDSESKGPVVQFFGVKEEEAPILLGFEMKKTRKYRLRESLTDASILAFAKGVVEGTVQPEYKSAPVPDEPTDGGVTVVVGKNFDKIVKDSKKDVLLEVYAPWCGHCKKLEPIYKKLAKRFKTVESVVIAKMDGTENEHADVDAKGYPTILFFPAGEDKTPVSFDGGDRSLAALTKFIKKHAKVPYELPKKGKAKESEAEAAKDEL